MLHVNVRTVRGRGMVASLGDDGTVAQLRQAVATWFGRDVLHLIYLGRFLRDNTASVKTLCGGLSEEFVVAVLARTKYQQRGAVATPSTAAPDAVSAVHRSGASEDSSQVGDEKKDESGATGHADGVERLVDMGFSREQSRSALSTHHGDVQLAMNFLLSGGAEHTTGVSSDGELASVVRQLGRFARGNPEEMGFQVSAELTQELDEAAFLDLIQSHQQEEDFEGATHAFAPDSASSSSGPPDELDADSAGGSGASEDESDGGPPDHFEEDVEPVLNAAAVAQLVEMGATAEMAHLALLQTGGDVAAAVGVCFGGF